MKLQVEFFMYTINCYTDISEIQMLGLMPEVIGQSGF
jgi:hypothetical protein